jgi:tetratricopeptide (TPR) repeat protein
MTLSARFLLSASAVLLLTSAASLADKKDTFILRLRFKGDSATYLNRGSKLLVAARHRPGFFRTFVLRAMIYQRLGRDREALADLDKVFSLHADGETDATALATRAELRALSSDPSVRNPKAALADALHACQLNNWKRARNIETLATACAANGDFESAVRYEKQAIATGKLTPSELERAQRSLASYQHGKPQG